MHKSLSQLQISRSRLCGLIGATLLAAVCLAELYSLFGFGIGIESPWLAAAICNALLAVLIISARHYFPLSSLKHPIAVKLAYSPALVLLLLIMILAGFSRLYGGAEQQYINPEQWAWVLWIPISEEIVFRWGAGSILKRVGGMFWGSYFSVILFTLQHSNPTLQNLLRLNIGLALGPLLLGICCELILAYTGRIGAAIAFHMICNFSVVIFNLLDSRWLRWLGFLYL